MSKRIKADDAVLFLAEYRDSVIEECAKLLESRISGVVQIAGDDLRMSLKTNKSGTSIDPAPLMSFFSKKTGAALTWKPK